jgi:hypothetical protein
MENGKTGNRVNRSKTKNCSEETRQNRIPPTSSGGGSSAVGHQPFLERTVQQTRTRIGLLCFSVRYDFSRFYFGILSILAHPDPSSSAGGLKKARKNIPYLGRILSTVLGMSTFYFIRVFSKQAVVRASGIARPVSPYAAGGTTHGGTPGSLFSLGSPGIGQAYLWTAFSTSALEQAGTATVTG